MKISYIGLALAATLAVGPVSAQDVREAGRSDNFARLEGTSGPAPVPGPVPAPAPASTRVPTSVALRALAEISRSFDYGGNGDAEYWMKTDRDFVRSGRALGSAMITLARSMQGGPLAAAIGGVGAGLTSLDGAGTGNSDYWMLRTKEVAQRVTGAGQQLETIATSLQVADTVPAGALLEALAEVAGSLDYSGRGDSEYWMRTTRNFTFIGRGVGRAAAQAAGGLPSPLNAVVVSIANNLGSISEAGNGNSDYWMARARGVADQVTSAGRSLHDIAFNLP